MSASRTALLGTIAVLGAVPTVTGARAMLGGTATLPGRGPADATTESEYRFVNTFWAAAGPLLWWSLRAPEQRSQVTRLLLGLAAAGGVPRAIGWAVRGRPHPVFVGALGLELVGVPLTLLWHRAVFGGSPR